MDDFERDVLELARRLGTDEATVRQAAMDALNERVAAAAGGGDEDAVSAEHVRLAGNYGGQPGMPAWDPAKVFRTRQPAGAPLAAPDPRPAEPAPEDEAEIARLSEKYLADPDQLRLAAHSGAAGDGPSRSELAAARSAPDYPLAEFGTPAWAAERGLPALQAIWSSRHDADTVALAADISAAGRRALAAKGHALPDGSYPVPDVSHLHAAAILARSKHGDWQAAMKLIARRARELGVPNPLDGGQQKVAASAMTLALSMASGDEALGLARTSYHGGRNSRQAEVTTANRAHTNELDEDPTFDVDEYLDRLGSQNPDIGIRRRGSRQRKGARRVTDPTRGEHPDLESGGSQSVRPKSPAQRARERRAGRPKHTGTAVWD